LRRWPRLHPQCHAWKKTNFFPSLLSFFDLENETKNCSQMHPSAKAPTLKKSDSKITRASMTTADLLGDAQCITPSIDNCRLSVIESPTCRRRKSHHINGNALVATKSSGWR
jgi:hypothetical protein